MLPIGTQAMINILAPANLDLFNNVIITSS